jgi:hypothetical protein
MTSVLVQVRKEKWKALGAWVEIIALVLGQWSKRKTEEMEETLELLRGLAGMSLAERVKILPGWWVCLFSYDSSSETYSRRCPRRQANQAESEQLWRRCHQQILDAFSTPSNPAHAKKLAKLYGNGKRPLPEDLHEEILGWDGFLLGLGKMSLSRFYAFSYIYVNATTVQQISKVTVVSTPSILISTTHVFQTRRYGTSIDSKSLGSTSSLDKTSTRVRR